MNAVVLPFPLVRRCVYVARQADHMTCLPDDAADRYLCHQLKVQGDAMRRRGVAEELITRELRCLEAAIRRQFNAATGVA